MKNIVTNAICQLIETGYPGNKYEKIERWAIRRYGYDTFFDIRSVSFKKMFGTLTLVDGRLAQAIPWRKLA